LQICPALEATEGALLAPLPTLREMFFDWRSHDLAAHPR
jgi:hypothetical protein